MQHSSQNDNGCLQSINSALLPRIMPKSWNMLNLHVTKRPGQTLDISKHLRGIIAIINIFISQSRSSQNFGKNVEASSIVYTSEGIEQPGFWVNVTVLNIMFFGFLKAIFNECLFVHRSLQAAAARFFFFQARAISDTTWPNVHLIVYNSSLYPPPPSLIWLLLHVG